MSESVGKQSAVLSTDSSGSDDVGIYIDDGSSVASATTANPNSFQQPPLSYVNEKDVDVATSTYTPNSNDHPAVFSTAASRGQRKVTLASLDETKKTPEHCHVGLERDFDKQSMYRLMFACALTLLFVIGEFIGGYISHSLTIMSDAAHMLSDFASFLISLAAISIARKQASKRFSFGFHRAEVIGALVSIVIIWFLTGVLVYLAIIRTIHQDFTIEPNPMLITAACGVAFNIILGIALSGSGAHHGHSHSLPSFGHGHSHHGHSHDGASQTAHSHAGGHLTSPNGAGENSNYQISHSGNASHHEHTAAGSSDFISTASPVFSRLARKRTRSISVVAYPMEDLSKINKAKNINVRAAFVHVLGDLVQSIGVLIAAIIIKFKPEWKLADPICTFIFSVLVMITTFNVIKDILFVLMEGVPSDCEYDQIKRDLELIPGVRQAHSLHMWSLTMDKAALAAHLAIDTEGRYDAIEIMNRSTRMIRHKYNVMFVTIQVEQYDNAVMDDCKHCAGPKY